MLEVARGGVRVVVLAVEVVAGVDIDVVIQRNKGVRLRCGKRFPPRIIVFC